MPLPDVIYASTNRRFLPQAKIFLTSLRKNYPRHPEVLLFHPDLEESEIRALRRFPLVTPTQCSLEDFMAGPAMATHNRRFADPRMSYGRFMIWTDRFRDYETVLHLDVDLLILGPLDELFNKERFMTYAETYSGEDALFYDPKDPELLKKLHEDSITIPSPSANTGVFSVPKIFRSEEDHRLLLYLLERYEKYIKWSDQSVINLWIAKKGLEVSPERRFNFQHRLIENNDFSGIQEARIFHFNGVELAYRVPLMRIAWVLYGSFGWRLYRMIYLAADALLRLWRLRNGWKKGALNGN